MTGEWPTLNIGYRDGDSSNLRWDNLKQATTFDRLHSYRSKSREIENNLTRKVNSFRIIRATFTDEEVTKSVEEFLKEKEESV